MYPEEKTYQLTKGQRDRDLMLRMIDNTIRLDYAWRRAYAHYTSVNSYSTSIYDTFDSSKWEEHFILAVRKYLAEFRDSNLTLIVPERYANDAALPDFKAVRYRDKLIVIKALPGSNLMKGDCILQLGNRSVMDFRKIAKFYLPQNDADSTAEDWSLALASVNTVSIERDGKQLTVPVSRIPYATEKLTETESPAAPDCRILTDGTLLFSLRNLADSRELESILSDNIGFIQTASRIIFDLRACRASDDTAFLPFLSLCAESEELHTIELPASSYYTNYTGQNCLRRISMLENAKTDYDNELNAFLDSCIESTRKKIGQGIQLEADTELSVDDSLSVSTAANKIILFTDHDTEGAAERFVRSCRKLRRCITVGRTTRGSCDTFGLVTYPLGDGYGFVYPISITSQAHEDETAYAGLGIEPDIRLEWTPDMIEDDIELEYLLDLSAGAL